MSSAHEARVSRGTPLLRMHRRPTSRCSGRALRDEIGRILGHDLVLSALLISAARR
jgi:hypothetical protein